jgi:peptidase inhibitor I9
MPISPTVRFAAAVCVAVLAAGCSPAAPTAPKLTPLAPRVVAPPCSAPAQLLGSYSIPGYIVAFHDTIDATAETARLASRYQFTPRHVYTIALRGFSAPLADTVVAALRCERSVHSIEYDQLAHLD